MIQARAKTPVDSHRTWHLSVTPPYDPIVAKSTGPGLRKTRGLPLVERRTRELWRASDYRWRELFEHADVMSEGAVRRDADGQTYFGTTSVLLCTRRYGGEIDDSELDDAVRAASRDPHARLRAVRVACLEAQLRCAERLGSINAELSVRADPRGVRIDVEVEARVGAALPRLAAR